MRTIERLRRSAVGISPERTVHDAASVMDHAGVGALGVVDGDRLIGIVTDRDLVRRALSRNYPLDARVDGVMTSPVVTIDADADLHDAFALLRTHGVRRLGVVRGGEFVGMITVDDLLFVVLPTRGRRAARTYRSSCRRLRPTCRPSAAATCIRRRRRTACRRPWHRKGARCSPWSKSDRRSAGRPTSRRGSVPALGRGIGAADHRCEDAGRQSAADHLASRVCPG